MSYNEIDADPEVHFYNMDTYEYANVDQGDVRVMLLSNGQINLPGEIHYRDIRNLMSCLMFALQMGDRAWTKDPTAVDGNQP